MTEQNTAIDMLKAIHDDQSATLPSGREYKLTTVTHNQRRRVFAFSLSAKARSRQATFRFWTLRILSQSRK